MDTDIRQDNPQANASTICDNSDLKYLFANTDIAGTSQSTIQVASDRIKANYPEARSARIWCIVHEIGHTLGLGHTSDNFKDIMYPNLYNGKCDDYPQIITHKDVKYVKLDYSKARKLSQA